jgi:hypothetical protein
MAATKIGHGLAKVLGIKVDYRNELDDEIRRGESVFSTNTADTYVEQEPTSIEWVRETIPSAQELGVYARSLFPFTHWIGRYNVQWLLGDLVAGKLSNPSVFPLQAAHHHCRYHYRCCRRASGYGVCHSGFSTCSIWTLHLIHGRFNLLVLRNI